MSNDQVPYLICSKRSPEQSFWGELRSILSHIPVNLVVRCAQTYYSTDWVSLRENCSRTLTDGNCETQTATQVFQAQQCSPHYSRLVLE